VDVTNGDWAREIRVVARSTDGSIIHERWLKQYGQKTEGTIGETDQLLVIKARNVIRNNEHIALKAGDAIYPVGDEVELIFKSRLFTGTISVQMDQLLDVSDKYPNKADTAFYNSAPPSYIGVPKVLNYDSQHQTMVITPVENSASMTLRLQFEAIATPADNGVTVFFEKANLPKKGNRYNGSMYYMSGDKLYQSAFNFSAKVDPEVSSLGGLVAVRDVNTNMIINGVRKYRLELRMDNKPQSNLEVFGPAAYGAYPRYDSLGVDYVWVKPNVESERSLSLYAVHTDGTTEISVKTIAQKTIQQELKYTSWKDQKFIPGYWVNVIDGSYTKGYRWKCVYGTGSFLSGANIKTLAAASGGVVADTYKFLEYNYDALQMIQGVGATKLFWKAIVDEYLPISTAGNFVVQPTKKDGSTLYLPTEGPLVGLDPYPGGTKPWANFQNPLAILGQRAYISNAGWSKIEVEAPQGSVLHTSTQHGKHDFIPDAPKAFVEMNKYGAQGGLYKLTAPPEWVSGRQDDMTANSAYFRPIAPVEMTEFDGGLTWPGKDFYIEMYSAPVKQYTEVLHSTILLLTSGPQPIWPPEIVSTPPAKL
jgi:hypothetical protein